jgi:hypothetical protein
MTLQGLELRPFGRPARSQQLLFFYWYSGGFGPIGTAATNRAIVPAPGDCDDGEIGGMFGRGNRSILGENLPQCLFVHYKPHMVPKREPGPPRRKPASNRLSYGTAVASRYTDRAIAPRCKVLSGVFIYVKNIVVFHSHSLQLFFKRKLESTDMDIICIREHRSTKKGAVISVSAVHFNLSC